MRIWWNCSSGKARWYWNLILAKERPLCCLRGVGFPFPKFGAARLEGWKQSDRIHAQLLLGIFFQEVLFFIQKCPWYQKYFHSALYKDFEFKLHKFWNLNCLPWILFSLSGVGWQCSPDRTAGWRGWSKMAAWLALLFVLF